MVQSVGVSTASAQTSNCSASTSGETQLNESAFTATGSDMPAETGVQTPITQAVSHTDSSRFTSGAESASGMTYEVNMGSAQTFNEIDMYVPDYSGDYPRGYNVNVSTNGTSWTTVASCTATAQPTIVSFTGVTDQYLEVVLTAGSTGSWWSMEQFLIYNGSSTTTTTAATTTTTAATTTTTKPTTTTTAATTTTTKATTTTTAPTTTTTAAGANCTASTSGEAQLNESSFTASVADMSGATGVQTPITQAVSHTDSSRFTSGAAEAVGMTYEVNMEAAQTFNEIDMYVPDYATDYPRGYNVEVSTNGTNWTVVASCTATAQPTIASFATQTDQYVEVVLTAANATYWWSMEQFLVYNSSTSTTPTTTGTTGTTGTVPTTTTTTKPTTTTSSTTTSSTTTTSTSTTTTSSSTTTTTSGPGPTTGGPLPTSTVYVFTPSTPEATIQSDANTLYSDQAGNQFGTARYAMLFEPGTYGSASDPLLINMGYYEEVEGLGLTPTAVTIVGVINSYNQCSGDTCNATDNFWRSIINVTIDVNSAGTGSGSCYNDGDDFWASSQASPLRDVEVNDGTLTLMDFCESPAYASGGFISDSQLNTEVLNGSQQQYFTQTSNLSNWDGSVWNQVFCGDNGSPADAWTGSGSQFTSVATCGPTEEEPYLEWNGSNYEVFVPALETNQVGPIWASGNPAGTTLPWSDFYVASPSSSTSTIQAALNVGDDLILTPGVYDWGTTINVPDANTKIIGLGFPTLIPTNGQTTMTVADVAGVNISGVMFDAGTGGQSPSLLTVGVAGSTANYSSNPVTLDDIFFRVGGAETGSATDSLIDNSNYSIISDMWAWRADHGATAVGWTDNVGDTGLVVNGNDVSAQGLAVEHYEQTEVEWYGQGGSVYFFQNENPYDPPSQAAWMDGSQDGYPAFQVEPGVTSFEGYGLGSYCYFDLGVAIENAEAFETPVNSGDVFTHLFTVFLNGSGEIASVINGTGPAATSANDGSPQDVTSYN